MNDVTNQPTAPAPPSNKGAMLTVFLVVFIDLLGFGIVLPLLPRYADELIPVDASKETRGFVYGALLSVFSAMQFVFAPIWGRISDRIGRRPVLLIGLVGSVVSYAAFGLISDLMWGERGWLVLILLFLTRVGAGVSGATISTAASVIADCTTREKRAGGMALIGAAFGIGFTFGPLIAFGALRILNDYPGAPGYAAATLSLIALLIAWKKMPETKKHEAIPSKRGWLDLRILTDTLRTPTVGLLVLTFFLATFAFANFEATLSMLTKQGFRLPDDKNYLIFAYVGFVLMFAQGYVYRKLVKKLNELTLMRIGLFFMFLGLANLAGVTVSVGRDNVPPIAFAWFLVSLALAVFGFAFLNPSLNALISKRSDPARQGEVLGVNQSFSALARILGPVIGLELFEIDPSHVSPYALAAGLLLAVLFLLPKIQTPSEEAPAGQPLAGAGAPARGA
jgi:MFS transporter, DHA1 family, tetracycline resistance protein